MKPILGLLLTCAACGQSGLANSTTNMSQPDLARSTVPLVHRATAPTCPSDRPAAGCSLQGPIAQCHADADCTAGTNGRCSGNVHDGCNCTYDTCFSDADCPSGTLCACRNVAHADQGANVCLRSNCRTDADCGPGGYCSPSFDAGCGAYFGVTGWWCHTAADTCTKDSDCAAQDLGQGDGNFCGFFPQVGHWQCAVTSCVG
jgi:hypothetical protein